MLLISLDSVLIFQLLRKTKNNEEILLNIAEARRGGLRTDTAQEKERSCSGGGRPCSAGREALLRGRRSPCVVLGEKARFGRKWRNQAWTIRT